MLSGAQRRPTDLVSRSLVTLPKAENLLFWTWARTTEGRNRVPIPTCLPHSPPSSGVVQVRAGCNTSNPAIWALSIIKCVAMGTHFTSLNFSFIIYKLTPVEWITLKASFSSKVLAYLRRLMHLIASFHYCWPWSKLLCLLGYSKDNWYPCLLACLLQSALHSAVEWQLLEHKLVISLQWLLITWQPINIPFLGPLCPM
jgi:hypothetical protein